MNIIKANNLSYSLINKAITDDKKSPDYKAVNNDFKTPAFAAAPRITGLKEGLGSKALSLLSKGMKKIENGGFFVEFIVVDFVGMILPRTVQAYNRNREELGHPNYKAATEEFLREIITGPSMVLIPLAFLAGSKKMFGASSHVKLNMIEEFKKVSQTAIDNKSTEPDLVKGFYTKITENLYNKGSEEADPKLIENFIKLHKANSKKAIEKAKKALTKTLISTNKKIGNNAELGISSADSSKIKFNGIVKDVSDFVDDCHNYSSDVINILVKTGTDSISKIHEFKEGARKLVVSTTVAAIAGFYCFIPKIYQRNKQYPGIDGLVSKDNSAPGNKEAGK